jgi:uncharacterized protein YkwD
MHRRLTAVILGLVLGLAVAAGPGLACSKPGGASAMDKALIDWINAERGKKGLSRLSANAKLDAAAQGHACDMAAAGKMAHKLPGGPSFQSRVKSSGYKMRTAVENIAKSSRGTAEAAAQLWRESSGHWANILEPKLRDVGIGLATDGTSVYYVFVGGAPK